MINENDKINISGTYVRNLPYEQGAKIVDGKEVEGGYFVCESLPSWGTIGQLCYCTGSADSPINKFYKYDGSSWKELVIPKMVNGSNTALSQVKFTLSGTTLNITTTEAD